MFHSADSLQIAESRLHLSDTSGRAEQRGLLQGEAVKRPTDFDGFRSFSMTAPLSRLKQFSRHTPSLSPAYPEKELLNTYFSTYVLTHVVESLCTDSKIPRNPIQLHTTIKVNKCCIDFADPRSHDTKNEDRTVLLAPAPDPAGSQHRLVEREACDRRREDGDLRRSFPSHALRRPESM